MPASVIAERVGWERSMSMFRARGREIRPDFVPADPASRTSYQPGELMRCDLWFPPVRIPLGHGHSDSPPVLVMVSGYSRVMSALMIPSRHAADLIAGHWAPLSELGAVPKALVWDDEGAVGRWVGGKPVLTDAFQAFRGMLGIKVIQNRPRDPESKGVVERHNGYPETSFLPGRSFTGPADFNAQLSGWIQERANCRHHRRIECRPVDRLAADEAAMLELPPVAPVTGRRRSLRLPRDYHVRVDTCDYSVHPSAVGRRIEVHAGLQEVTATCDGLLVARHDRCWAPHQSITDPAHETAADTMRHAHLRVVGDRERADADHAEGDEVERRDLSGYDRMFGLDTDPAAA